VLRLAFMGTPDFAVPTLRSLFHAGHEIVAVYSQPPRAGGRRGLERIASPVHEAARALGLPVLTPTFFDEKAQHQFAALKLDAAVVVAYGIILPVPVLAAPRFGCYNGHASLLPRWRGAAPIQRAIMAGDGETGMMIMKMEAGLDTGPIALVQKLALSAEMTAGQLHDDLSHIGADLMVAAMAQLECGQLSLQPQGDVGVTYAHKITKQETRIDWSRPVIEIERMIRAFAPAPGAWCEMKIAGRRERVKILAAQMQAPTDADILPVLCGDGGKIFLTLLQKSGGRPLAAPEFLRGHPIEDIV